MPDAELEKRLRAKGWMLSEELIGTKRSKLLTAALGALDAKSLDDLEFDLKSDDFRFFNKKTSKFHAGKNWRDIRD